MALDGIKCTVDTCQFWAAGNRCEADKIEVDINHQAARRTGAGAGMEIGEMGGRYRRGVIEPEEDFFEIGELGTRREGAGVPGPTRGGSTRAYQSEHTCCRTFRPR